MSAQMYAMLLAFPFLIYTVVEDLKYREAITLPLLLVIAIETILRLVYARHLWSFYFFILLTVGFAVAHKKWPKLLPEVDVYILVAVMSALWDPWSLYVFIIALAAIDVAFRAVYAVAGKGGEAFTKMPLPLAPEAFAAFVVTFVAYALGSMHQLNSLVVG